MLVLTRKIGERIRIDNEIVVEVLAAAGNQIRLGIQAPASVSIRREELPARGRLSARAEPAEPATIMPDGARGPSSSGSES